MTIHQAKFGTGLGCSEYATLYGAEDPSGVTRVQFIKEGDVHEDLQFDGRPTNIGGRVYFTVGFLETSTDAVTGTTVDITAEDVHNSKTRELAVERANFYGNLAGELDHSNIYTQTAAYQLAQISGFTSSWGSTAREAKQSAEGTYEAYQALREDPVEYLRGVVSIVEVLERYGILDTLVEAFVGPLQQKQETNNPYDEAENPTLYSTYKVGWYEGFVAGKVSQIVVTFGAGQAVKGTTTAKRVDDFASSTKTYKIAKRIKPPYDTTKARATAKLLSGSKRIGSATVGGVKSVGSGVRVWRLSRRVDVDGTDLSETGQENLRWYLEVTGEDGVDKLNRMDKEDSSRFLNLGTTCKVPGFSISSTGDGCGLSDSERERLVQTVASSTDNPDSFATKVADLDPKTQREIYRELVEVDSETGDDLVWMVEKVSAKRLDELRAGDIDLSRHAEGVDTYRRYKQLNKDVKSDGDMTELLAHDKLQQQYKGEGNLYPQYGLGLDIEVDGLRIAEIDHFVVDDGKVVRVIETKKNPNDALTAKNDLAEKIEAMQRYNYEFDDKGGPTGDLSNRVDFSQIDETDDSRLITVGPKDAKSLSGEQSDFDVYLDFNRQEIEALTKTIKEEGI